MLHQLLLVASGLARLATAQTSVVSSTASDAQLNTTASTSISAQLTTSLLLPPIDYPGQIVASVITANQNWTAYLLQCLPREQQQDLNHTRCELAQPVTLTEGVSTFIYTFPPSSNRRSSISDGTSSSPPTTTSITTSPPSEPSTYANPEISCQLFGGTRASKAVCTGHSMISGLGKAGSTTTLASTQLTYIDVTITAGAETITGAMATATTATTEGAAVAVKTAAAGWAAVGVAGGAAFLGAF